MTTTERTWNDFEPADLGQEIARTVEQMIRERDEELDREQARREACTDMRLAAERRVERLRMALADIIKLSRSVPVIHGIARGALENDNA